VEASRVPVSSQGLCSGRKLTSVLDTASGVLVKALQELWSVLLSRCSRSSRSWFPLEYHWLYDTTSGIPMETSRVPVVPLQGLCSGHKLTSVLDTASGVLVEALHELWSVS
jgi:hypothetical protein